MNTKNSTINNLLKEIAKSKNMTDYKIEINDDLIKGNGMFAIVSGAKIVGTDGSQKEKVLHFVIKNVTNSDNLRALLDITNIFSREIYMYNSVLKAYQVLEIAKGLSPTVASPKFYGGSEEDKHEVLILENLNESGFQAYPGHSFLDDSHVRLVIEKCASLHALSFALKDQNPERFEKISKMMSIDLFRIGVEKSKFVKYFIQQCEQAQLSLDPDKDIGAIEKYKRFLPLVERFFKEPYSAIDEYSVVLLYDCWINNMMFKYQLDENRMQPTDVCFYDFQISVMGSPVLDLSYFLYSSANKEVINNLQFYLQMYYAKLAGYLRTLGSNPDQLFPFQVFQEHWKQQAKICLIRIFFVLNNMLKEKDRLFNFSHAAYKHSDEDLEPAFDNEVKKRDEYNDRARFLILHFVESNYL